jgi:hypothetical protein
MHGNTIIKRQLEARGKELVVVSFKAVLRGISLEELMEVTAAGKNVPGSD